MSIGAMGGVSSLAASPTTQRTSDTEKTQAATAEKAGVDAAAEYTEQAAGIGTTKEESEAGDRDADGRRLWEFGDKKKDEAAEASETAPPPKSKDPTGTAGSSLDLEG